MPSTAPSFSTIFLTPAGANVRFVRLQWVDYTGIVRLRLLPISTVQRNFQTGWNIGITQAALSVLHDDTPLPDMLATNMYGLSPAWSSLRSYRPVESQHAIVQCSLSETTGEPAELCPRSILTQAVAEAMDLHKLNLKLGFETEVIFLQRDASGVPKTAIPNAHSWTTASALQPERLALCEEISDALEAAGIEVGMFHPEAADGQFEFSTGPLDPVAAVDTLYATRQIIDAAAMKRGLRATLHPQPIAMQPGSSCHMHFSLGGSVGTDTEKNFVGGVLKRLRSLTALGLASPCSYARVNDNMWAAGSWVCWGEENREVPLRKIKGEKVHWELRTVDATANAYLVAAGMIYAGLIGLQEGATLGKGCSPNPANLTEEQRKELNISEKLPKGLVEALGELDRDSELTSKLGEGMVKKYLMLKHAESEKMEAMDQESRWRWEVERF